MMDLKTKTPPARAGQNQRRSCKRQARFEPKFTLAECGFPYWHHNPALWDRRRV